MKVQKVLHTIYLALFATNKNRIHLPKIKVTDLTRFKFSNKVFLKHNLQVDPIKLKNNLLHTSPFLFQKAISKSIINLKYPENV